MKSMIIIQPARTGMLAEITTMLEQCGVNLISIDATSAEGLAVINLTAEPYEKCFDALKSADFKVFEQPQILVRLPDQPGALAEVSRTLANRQVDVQNVHVVSKDGNDCLVALSTDNDYCARQVLRDIVV